MKIVTKTSPPIMYYFGFVEFYGHKLEPNTGKIPFSIYDLDCGEFLPTAYLKKGKWQHHSQPQSACKITHTKDFTIMALWDRSGDSRTNSNTSFLIQGEHDFKEMMKLAFANFHHVVVRIENLKPMYVYEPEALDVKTEE